MGAPVTRAENLRETIHGVEVEDPYRWLEDGDSPEVAAWTAAQNARTRAWLDPLPLRARLERRLRQVMDVGALGVSVPRAARRFFTRRAPGADQPCLYVAEGGAETLLVDPVALAGDPTAALDWWYPSREGRRVAFGVSTGGDEISTLHLLEVGGGLLPDRIARCLLCSLAFEPGGDAFLYTRYPAPGEVPAGEEHYHRHLFRHVVGTDPKDDPVLLGPGRDKTDFISDLSISDDGRWWLAGIAQGWTRTAVHLAPAGGEFRSVFEGVDAIAEAGFHGNRLLVRTNHQAPNWRLCEAQPADPAPERWRDLVPESEHVLVEAHAAGPRLLVHHLVSACSRVAVHSLGGEHERDLDLPPFVSVSGIGAEHSAPGAYLSVTSFTRPAAVLSVDVRDATLSEVESLATPPGFDPVAYPVRQVRYPSTGGAEVTMFLVGRPAGTGPAVLSGYGGFQVSRTPEWMPAVVPFLEGGGLFALANLRGGAEYGERWHRDGMLGRKQHTFDDFIAAGGWLVREGLTTPARLGIIGGSNGGLLVGAAVTQRPDLFGAAVSKVPLLDMVRYERFRVAQLWADEYGSASDPEALRWLLAYSPYHRVREGVRYPPVLLTTGEGDSRVDPMHARKMSARLQAAYPEGLTLLRVEERAGHGQGKPVSKLVPEEADCWTFLMANLGMG